MYIVVDISLLLNNVGTKCPTGQFLYQIKTEDNEKVQNIFNDLSHHKPIFTDDRMGRRMTQEHIFLQKIISRPKVGGRLSYQPNDSHTYQNNTTTGQGHRRSVQDQNRPRTQAVTTDASYDPPVLPHSTSAADFSGDTFYYNLAETMQKGSHKPQELSLPASTKLRPASLSPTDYHSYYNMSSTGEIPPLSDPSVFSRPAATSPTRLTGTDDDTQDSDEEDFVDINNLSNHAKANYCNITELMSPKQQKQEQQNYINIAPAGDSR